MNVYAVTQFDGGMNNVISPSLLEPNCAVELVNADVTSGKITPVRRPVLLEHNDPEDYGHYGGPNKSVVTWYERHYWSNNTATTAPYYGGKEENYLGIPYPTYSGTGANVSVAGGTPASGETGISGDFKYCVTFVNANGWEGAPGSNEEYETAVTLSSQTGVVTVSWSSTIVSKAKIYRTIDHGADFYCIGEITTSGGGTFRDTVPDTDAQLMNPLSTIEYFPPPDHGKFLCEAGGVFFLAVGSLLYFSVQGNPHAWPTTQFIVFDDVITGIVPEFQGVLVFTADSAFRVVGAESPETITKTYIPGNCGCLNYRTIACLNNAPVWLSREGVSIWDGNSVTCLSSRVIKNQFTGIKYAACADDKYFLFCSDDTLVFDRKNGGIFYKLSFVCEYAWHDSASGFFYLKSGNFIYHYGQGLPLTVKYRSPDIGGASPALKVFRELIFSVTQECDLRILVDGEEKAAFNISGGRTRIKLPLSAVGFALSLRFATQGDVNGFTVLYD